MPAPPVRSSAGAAFVQRLRSSRSALPFALLVVALVALMHTGPAHACESPAATPAGTTAHAPAAHVTAPAGRALTTGHHRGEHAEASPAPQSAAGGGAAGQVCTSAAPPQVPVLGPGAVVTTAPAPTYHPTGSSSPWSPTGDRGPSSTSRPALCVWRI